MHRSTQRGGMPTEKKNTSSLPLPLGRPARVVVSNTTAGTQNESRLKLQLDDCERRRKNLVVQSQKLTRENEAMDKKYKHLLTEHETLKKSHETTRNELFELKRVSEAMYIEYEKLLQRFDVETDAMHKAMQKATSWYKQNRALKRRSAILEQRVLLVSPESIADMEEGTFAEKDEDELDDLRRSVKELSSEVASLQVELNKVKLSEFEAQEQLLEVTEQLEAEREAGVSARAELAELRPRAQTLQQLASLEASELAELRHRLELERQAASHSRKEADQAKKERNVLAHQSSLLLADLAGEERIVLLLQDIEALKAKLEDDASKHNLQVAELQNQIFELQSENRLEVLEEKLKLSEAELSSEQTKAERAHLRIKELEELVHELESTREATPVAPPPPPLPPPPPPPAFSDHVGTPSSRTIGDKLQQLKPAVTGSTIKRTPTLQSGNAIDEIIDQIKAGKFQLKATERQKWRQDEQPAAVQEMLQILGTMKRSTKQKNYDMPDQC